MDLLFPLIMNRHRLGCLVGFWVLCLTTMASTVWACKVPVFRYALERWDTDRYRAVVFYRSGGAQSETAALVERLRGAEAQFVNIEVESVDLDKLTEEQMWHYDDVESLEGLPRMRLYYPFETKIEEPFWEGPLTAENVARTLDSPLRRGLVEKVLSGSSTTWLLLESGRAEDDEAAHERLVSLLQTAAAKLTIPEGVVRAEDVTAGGTTADGKPLEMDDVLRSSVPLKIEFPVLRLSVEDRAEEIFRAMLTGFQAKGSPFEKEPLAVAVFGRGRALQGIAASELNPDSIEGACAYLCGECSCQVKDQNPGIDLILKADWSTRLKGSGLVIERQLPELSGIGLGPGLGLAASSDQNTESSGVVEALQHQSASRELAKAEPRRLPRSLVYAVGGLLLTVLVGTYLMTRRQSG